MSSLPWDITPEKKLMNAKKWDRIKEERSLSRCLSSFIELSFLPVRLNEVILETSNQKLMKIRLDGGFLAEELYSRELLENHVRRSFMLLKCYRNLFVDFLSLIVVVDNQKNNMNAKQKGVDHFISYQLASTRSDLTVEFKVGLSGSIFYSIKQEFAAAEWAEREVYDMHGIIFLNNTNLRRILTDYGSKGHPLQKRYPISGFVETYWDSDVQTVSARPINLAQEARHFETQNPWTGTDGTRSRITHRHLYVPKK